MKTQNQIKHTLSDASSLLHLNDLLRNNRYSNRQKFVRQVCQDYRFYNPQGNEQLSGCSKALRELEAGGHIVLPKTKRKVQNQTIMRFPQRLALYLWLLMFLSGSMTLKICN